MRVLFACRPFLGHLYPMVPLARALIRDGHEVVFASTDRFVGNVVDLGLEAVAAGLDPCASYDEKGRAAPEGGYGPSVIRSKTEDILAWAQTTEVDLVVREPTDFAGMLAAEAMEVPQVTLGRSQFLSASFWHSHAGWALALARQELGLPADPELAGIFGSCYLDMVPSWFQPVVAELPGSRVEISPQTFDGQHDMPHGAPARERGQNVYVTFGTVYNRNHAVIRDAVEGVARLGRAVVCTVGSNQDPDVVMPSEVPQVQVARYIPQSTVLSDCALVVCHGGYSTVMGTICAGVPLVLVPQGSDHHANARQCERVGVGVTVSPDDFSADAVESAARAVLADPSYAHHATSLADRATASTSMEFGARLLRRLPVLYRLGVDAAGQPLRAKVARPRAAP